MRDRFSDGAHLAVPKLMLMALLSLLVLGMAGCKEPNKNTGTVITDTQLPLDTLLNLSCENVGVHLETCVLVDPENPFRNTPIAEFDENNPDAPTKFDVVDGLPAGAAGAKSRVYFWATALARQPSGENQWYTARAFHELFDAAGDPIIQEQALKAYRSVWDNFFGSVTFFECCASVDPEGNPVPFSVTLNELVADNVFRTQSTGWARLVPGDPLLTLSLFSEWGYTYVPATPPDFSDGVLTKSIF